MMKIGTDKIGRAAKRKEQESSCSHHVKGFIADLGKV